MSGDRKNDKGAAAEETNTDKNVIKVDTETYLRGTQPVAFESLHFIREINADKADLIQKYYDEINLQIDDSGN